MHMADALLSTTVGAAMCAVSAAAIGYSIAKIKNNELTEKKIPIMAIAGAFVFAAQMINFTIPGTGSSGHIGGGILLAALLGSFPALLTISSVLMIQCLFFSDGGLLALGCNIFNLGVVPCLIVYPLLFKPIAAKQLSANNICMASIIAAILSLQLGAFGVVLQTQASGITALPFKTFTILMQSIHLAIGVVEGIITAGVLRFVFKIEPQILENANAGAAAGKAGKTISVMEKTKKAGKTISATKIVVITLIAITVVTGGILSIFASSNPDGLEWAIEKTAGEELETQEPLMETLSRIQDTTAIMPNYDYKSSGNEENSAGGISTGTSVAGIIGSAMTFLFAAAIALIISVVKKKKRRAFCRLQIKRN